MGGARANCMLHKGSVALAHASPYRVAFAFAAVCTNESARLYATPNHSIQQRQMRSNISAKRDGSCVPQWTCWPVCMVITQSGRLLQHASSAGDSMLQEPLEH